MPSLFQSTLPGWGATAVGVDESHRGRISIHAPRMGSDMSVMRSSEYDKIFQSTLPGWGATAAAVEFEIAAEISIHAPRMGSDALEITVNAKDKTISIHAPRMGSDPIPR